MSQCRVSIFHDRQLVSELTVDSDLIIGRRDPRPGVDDPPPFTVHKTESGVSRLVIADFRQQRVPREWFRLRPQVDGQFRLDNLHHRNAVQLIHDESPIAPGACKTFAREVTIYVTRDITLRIQPGREMDTETREYRSLNSVPLIPGQETINIRPKTLSELNDADEMVKMLRLALQVVQSANGSPGYFRSALAATTNIVDLDRTVLLIREDARASWQSSEKCEFKNGWAVADQFNKADQLDKNDDIDARGTDAETGHHFAAAPSTPISPAESQISLRLLQRMTQLGRTVVHDSESNADSAESLLGVECAVVAPILNSDREVIGALYGDRRRVSLINIGASISDLEATLVEILAGAVSGGIALQAEEKNRGKLAGFFSPKVADLLISNPELMEGQDAEVTILFCDIRGFSAATEHLGPKRSIQWINDVMSELTECVIQRDGVLVDYVGDELLAMWGAPGDQPNHAALAVEAAQAMMVTIETLRERWSDELPSRFGAGIGINTGQARVGNIGSRQKFKYGPLGHTVNVGARLQTATKQLGIHCSVSGTTIQQLKNRNLSRRIAKLNVVGIGEVIDVFELVTPPAEPSVHPWEQLKSDYEAALTDYENANFADAARRLGAILPLFPSDGPSLKLLSKVVAELDESTDDFDGVWRLTAK